MLVYIVVFRNAIWPAAEFLKKEVKCMVIGGIVAGGVGSRMGDSKVPKQFLDIAGKPIIIHTVEKFLVSPDIDYVVIGVHPDWVDYLEDLCRKYLRSNPDVVITPGGAARNDTICNIIEKAKECFPVDEETVFVTHDAVRPFVSLKIIAQNVDAARKFGVCDTVIPASDTIVRSSNGEYITDIPLRSEMYQGQTPQSFKYGLFKEVYENISEEELAAATDVCKLFYLRGHKVELVEGTVSNFKVTYPFELKMARSMLEEK